MEMKNEVIQCNDHTINNRPGAYFVDVGYWQKILSYTCTLLIQLYSAEQFILLVALYFIV